ncbi:MAG TPA: dihydroorotate dehydrogenase electron transfer subunit [Candidatus Dormibacteraeota bacterium]|nr:dihydroorotate dehydrogenase electron transfer subunit [Candidatus Dormibacteraeota bacterium]
MSADLEHARVERGEVLRVERLGHLIELSARLPLLAAAVRPGQFAQLRCSQSTVPLLRRPFSIAWTDGEICSFVFDEVGVGTRLLGALEPGDTLDVLGPLGTGFTLASRGPAVCVSGGVGCAPFPLLVRALRRSGVADIIVFNGAATASKLYPAERFQRGDVNVRVVEATDDGSRGRHGFVTELLDPRQSVAAVYACGPNAMLASLAAALEGARPAPGSVVEASLEAPMGCGFGTCLGCALPVRRADAEAAWALCCTDGPVMPMRDVDWQALSALPGADVA